MTKDLDRISESSPHSGSMPVVFSRHLVRSVIVSLSVPLLRFSLAMPVMLVSMKELYGWTCIIGIFFLLMLLSYRYLNRNTVGRLPGMRQIKRVMKRNVSY